MIQRDDVNEILQKLYFITGADAFFDPPLMKIAAADDPFFLKFKEVIGEYHWTPEEIVPGAKSVICYFLPARLDARESNRRENEFPSLLWARVRSYGELANEQMRYQLCRNLEGRGYAAVAPHLLQMKQGLDMAAMGFSSHWSERHASFVAGLGTFGLSASLISERGSAGRYGSVVTTLELPPDVRPYGDDPFAWCNRCGACIRRCPANAIGKEIADRDKPACAMYAYKKVEENRLERYGWDTLTLGCGLCQTGVPCEDKIPRSRQD